MLHSAYYQEIDQEVFIKLSEIESEIEEKLFVKNELSYLDHAKIQDLSNQITKIYLKYAPQEIQDRVAILKDLIKELIKEEDFSIREYSELDRELKKVLKALKRPELMTRLDEVRVERFQERINEIYEQHEPNAKELISIERLLEKRETLLLGA